MSNSDVPLVVLTTCKSVDTEDTTLDDINDVNDVILATSRQMLDHQLPLMNMETTQIPSIPTTTDLKTVTTTNNNVRRTASVKSEGPPSYSSIFSDRAHSKTRLSLPSARDAFRRLSDTWRHVTPRSSMTSVYPESPTSVTTLTGFIIRDKNAEFETQTRQNNEAQTYAQRLSHPRLKQADISPIIAQVFRLAAVLLVCGTAILILETVTSLYSDVIVTGYSYAGMGAGVWISCTGVLGIVSATRKDCPQKYFCYYKGLSLISLLMGVVVLCGTLANLDVRWLSHSSQEANIGEVVLYITKVLLAGVDIAAALASIYI